MKKKEAEGREGGEEKKRKAETIKFIPVDC